MGESNSISEKLLNDSFKKIIKDEDEVIVLYSGIWSFINKINFKKNIGKKILDIIENIVTPKRTLILPSFSSEAFKKENKFDLKLSLDNKNGIISKEALSIMVWSNTISSSVFSLSKLKLYLKPEQPPP